MTVQGEWGRKITTNWALGRNYIKDGDSGLQYATSVLTKYHSVPSAVNFNSSYVTLSSMNWSTDQSVMFPYVLVNCVVHADGNT